jgi:photosystem II stability/assembly factor-like uncharacterized protein
MGIEIQVTTFAYDSSNALGDVIFKRYKLINKSNSEISDMYFSYWSDPDLGDYADDYVGCNIGRDLGYTYNGNENDSKYGSPPPSVGYDLLLGPIVPGSQGQFGYLNGTWRQGYANLPLTSFLYCRGGDPNFSDPPWNSDGAIRTYNFQQGLDYYGNQIINPVSGQITKYCFPGDPVTGNGWTDQSSNPPGDRRHYISTGPFNFAPSDTQEVVIAILISKGTDRLNSINTLMNKDNYAQYFYDNYLTPPRPRTFNDFSYYININKIKMFQSNNGIGANSPEGKSGFHWPYDENDSTTAVFADGLLWGGYADGNLKVGGNHHRSGLEAGKILSDGTPDSVTSQRCRVYRIRKDWGSLPPGPLRDSLETDYNQWPVEDGAPWIDLNGNGTFERGIDEPEFAGDEVLWFVANDLDASRTHSLYGSDPIGLEMQVTTFAYDSTNDLADIVFKKYKLINKSGSNISDMYLSYWSDPDLGFESDDFIGCDTLLNLGFTYNANEYDNIYGSPPPSVGYNLLRGPIVPAASNQLGFLNGTWRSGYKNLKMTSFNFTQREDPTYNDPPTNEYEGTIQTYNLLRGMDKNGNPITDPTTGQTTKYCFPGNLETGHGWIDNYSRPPGDKRHYISMGPFNFAETDTQEVMLAILIDKGTDRLNSITELKNKDEFLQSFYYEHFLPPIPDFEIQCDMSNQILEGAFDPAADQLKVMANFNGWGGDFMIDSDNDSVYSFTLHEVAFDSVLEFKFWTTPDRWEAFPERRFVEVGESPGGYYAYFNDDNVYSPPKNIVVNYRCDMTIEIQFGRFNPATDQVKLMGYQYWWGTGVEMINNGSNVYEYRDTLLLGVNDYIPGYKFFYTQNNTWEGGDNKTYQVTQGDYDFGEITITRFFNQDQLPSVEFQCDMTVQVLEGNFNPAADQVQVRGNFNGWSGTELTDPDGDWIYTNLIFNFEVDSLLVFKFWHSPDRWEDGDDRQYTVTPNPQSYFAFFNNDDDPTNGERLWEAQASNVGNTLMEVNFVNDSRGWAVGNDGIIINTTDGGESWSLQTSNTNQVLWSVSFADENNGWAVGNSGTILNTADGGSNWDVISGVTSEPLREVFFIDANTGWVAGGNGTIIKTTDAGISWNNQTTNTSLRFQSIYFVDSNIGWAVGESGMIIRTVNGGQDWFLQTSNTSNYLLDAHFESASTGWVVGWTGTILKTTDGGNNWVLKDSKLPQGNRNQFYNVWFTDMFHGWAVGRYGIIRYTSDGGETWLPQYSTTTENLFGVMFPTKSSGWIVGTSGTVLKYFNELPLEWQTTISVEDASGLRVSKQIIFGQNPDATDGIDPDLGEEEMPPLPPITAFDVRFILPDPSLASLIDFRNISKSRIDWNIQFQPGSAGYPISFFWDPNELPDGSVYLKDWIDGSIININMHEQNSYVLTNESITSLRIEYAKTACSETDLQAGWNMISVPVIVNNTDVNFLFPNRIADVFTYENQYVACEFLEVGKGYWLKLGPPEQINFCGFVADDIVPVKTGWNMICAFEYDLPVSQISPVPSGIIISNFWGFDNSYFSTSNLEHGKGYWVKVNQDGTLHYNRLMKNRTDNIAEANSDWGKIIIKDLNERSTTLYSAVKNADLSFYEMPPMPPSGSFDARYTTNKLAENLETPKDIIISYALYPISIKVEGASFRIRDKIDGSKVDKLLKNGEELVIADPAINMLEITGALIPAQFELSQNYPNPFNPATTIQFGLPVSSKVKIAVYNILGEQVIVLTDKEYDAGYHKLIFNADALSSGVYFYRIEALPDGKQAGNFMDVKKLLLIK